MTFLSLRAPILALAAFALCATSSPARADEVYTFVVKKQEQKAKTRWSLQEWLETRDRMRLMDLWLALHSPSPYEFMLGGDYNLVDSGLPDQLQSWRLHAAAYASIFGLSFQRELADSGEWQALFNLRVIGFQTQGTNFTLHAGLRSKDEGARFRNPVAGASATMYFTRFFGLDGLLRYYFKSLPNAEASHATGVRFEGGAFIDFKFLRVYGSYFKEPETVTHDGGAKTKTSRSGAVFGTRFYF